MFQNTRMAKKRTGRRAATSANVSESGMARTVMARLEAYGVLEDFNGLIDKGCDKDGLIYFLFVLVHRTADLDDASFWFNDQRPTQVRRLLSEIRQVANRIRALESGPFGALRFYAPFELHGLPETLDQYAEFVARERDRFRAGRRAVADTRLGQLVRYVFTRTDGYQDQAVSALVAAMRKTDYSLTAHKQWRHRYFRSDDTVRASSRRSRVVTAKRTK